jgi:hypothetical protein
LSSAGFNPQLLLIIPARLVLLPACLLPPSWLRAFNTVTGQNLISLSPRIAPP